MEIILLPGKPGLPACRGWGGGGGSAHKFLYLNFCEQVGSDPTLGVFGCTRLKSRGLYTVRSWPYFKSTGPESGGCLMLKEGSSIGKREKPQVTLHAPAGSSWLLFLPGAFPNKVRGGKVPVIVQPRFDRVLVPLLLRPRAAGAGPLHDKPSSPRSAGAGFPLQLGSSPRRSRTRLETLPLRPASVGFRRSCSGAGPASCRAPPLPVLIASRCGGRGGAAAPRLPRGLSEAGSGSLSRLQIPRRPGGDWRALRKPSGQDARGGQAAAGGRCAPSRLRRSARR